MGIIFQDTQCCDSGDPDARTRPQVNELKTLTHSLFQIRDDHRREIEQLKEDASTMTSTSPGRASMSHLFPTDDVAAAREEAATLQVQGRVS